MTDVTFNPLPKRFDFVGGSGGGTVTELCYSISLTTNSTTFQTIATYSVTTGTALRLMFETVVRKSDGTEHALFQRIGLFYNESGTVTTDKLWHSTTTVKSLETFNVQYVFSGADILLQVKAPTTDTFYWKGRYCVLDVTTI